MDRAPFDDPSSIIGWQAEIKETLDLFKEVRASAARIREEARLLRSASEAARQQSKAIRGRQQELRARLSICQTAWEGIARR